jgi:hypothetical protein
MLCVTFCMVMLSVIMLHVIILKVVALSKCKVLHQGRLRPYWQILDQLENPTRDKRTILFRCCVIDEDKKSFFNIVSRKTPFIPYSISSYNNNNNNNNRGGTIEIEEARDQCYKASLSLIYKFS